MGIVSWLLLGLIAGFLASMVMKGGGYGIIGDIIVGIIGAFVGGFVFSLVTKQPDAVNNFDIGSIFVAFIGACILIAVLRVSSGRRRAI